MFSGNIWYDFYLNYYVTREKRIETLILVAFMSNFDYFDTNIGQKWKVSSLLTFRNVDW